MSFGKHLTSTIIVRDDKDRMYTLFNGEAFYRNPIDNEWEKIDHTRDDFTHVVSIDNRVLFISSTGVYELHGDNKIFIIEGMDDVVGSNYNIRDVFISEDRLYLCGDDTVIEFDVYDKSWIKREHNELPNGATVTSVLYNVVKELDYTRFDNYNPVTGEAIDLNITAYLEKVLHSIDFGDSVNPEFTTIEDMHVIISDYIKLLEVNFNNLKAIIDNSPSNILEKFSSDLIMFMGSAKNRIHNERITNPTFREAYINRSIEVGSPGSDRSRSITPLPDPSKNALSGSSIISRDVLTGGNSELLGIPIFTIIPKRMNSIPAFLLEVRISTPSMNYKGLISSTVARDGVTKGVEFFAEYITSHEKDLVIGYVYNATGIEFGLYKSYSDDLDESVIPVNYTVTPLIVNDVDVDRLVVKSSYKPGVLMSSPSGLVGDLTDNGHGPISKRIEGKFPLELIDPKIDTNYFAEKDSIALTESTPLKTPIGRFVHLKISPDSYQSNIPSSIVGSNVLRTHFNTGDSKYGNFSMLELLTSIYKFDKSQSLRCNGKIVVNNILIPIIGMDVDDINGNVKFMISPYYKIDNSLKTIVSHQGTDDIRYPYIIFDSNVNNPCDSNDTGFIGDGVSGDFNIGSSKPTQQRLLLTRSKYSVSLIDILIDFPAITSIRRCVKPGMRYTYTGNFSKFDFDFKQHDYDTFPYPGEDRSIIGSTVLPIPGLHVPVTEIDGFDTGRPMTWFDTGNSMFYKS